MATAPTYNLEGLCRELDYFLQAESPLNRATCTVPSAPHSRPLLPQPDSTRVSSTKLFIATTTLNTTAAIMCTHWHQNIAVRRAIEVPTCTFASSDRLERHYHQICQAYGLGEPTQSKLMMLLTTSVTQRHSLPMVSPGTRLRYPGRYR